MQMAEAMAPKSSRKVKPSPRPQASAAKFLKNPKVAFALALIFMDALLVALIIAYVPYTKIDWDAYMSQVAGFLEGERDYSNLKGDTGPLVYPAGFLYVYSAIQYVTGGDVSSSASMVGSCLALSLKKSALNLCAASLYDCFAMTFLHAALALLLCQQWYLGLILFSGAVSIKMNVLLYATFIASYVKGVILALSGAALVQEKMGGNLSDYKILYPPIEKPYLDLFSRHEGGLFNFLHSKAVSIKQPSALSSSIGLSFKTLKEEHIMTMMFSGNFIGIFCARSLHYQFYSWYFYSLPYLLWRTPFPTLLRLILFVGVEFCWNVYPSNNFSSALLLFLHLVILWGQWSSPSKYPYKDDQLSTKEKHR
ncbi:hypothetical protein GH714_023659 [Hevea brasiliensis]|uniref:dolichyl-P-Man:Man5GlcNAc2-PP-dolichol alpha-1,3-mannosyltransferase n=1 Tax=Hevea brasiliensis TaxID=3981 RepID=A0A6A6LBT0_HEVBR|nr:hypothetical protein GH714_023659 [Hevea brasiliensis]